MYKRSDYLDPESERSYHATIRASVIGVPTIAVLFVLLRYFGGCDLEPERRAMANKIWTFLQQHPHANKDGRCREIVVDRDAVAYKLEPDEPLEDKYKIRACPSNSMLVRSRKGSFNLLDSNDQIPGYLNHMVASMKRYGYTRKMHVFPR